MYAVEANAAAAELARATVAFVQDPSTPDHIAPGTIEVIEGFSTAITLPERADLLVSEIVGSIASEEGMYTSIRNARLRQMKLTCNHCEIQTPCLAPLLRFGPNTPYIAPRSVEGIAGIRPMGLTLSSASPLPEIIPQSDDFSRLREGLLASTPGSAPPRDACSGVAVHGPRQERGARACPRQPPRPVSHPHSTHPPTTHFRRGAQEFEEWEAGEVGGEKGPGANVATADQDPGEPTGHRWGGALPCGSACVGSRVPTPREL